MIKTHSKAFTLIELIVVITIVGMISVASYLPYAHHQKKTAVKQSTREVAQTLAKARNIALHGFDAGDGNANIIVELTPGAGIIPLYRYLPDRSREGGEEEGDIGEETERTEHSQQVLPEGVEIFSIAGEKNNFVIEYEAINGNIKINNSGEDLDEFDIVLAYKGTESEVLQKTLRYYPESFISDY